MAHTSSPRSRAWLRIALGVLGVLAVVGTAVIGSAVFAGDGERDDARSAIGGIEIDTAWFDDGVDLVVTERFDNTTGEAVEAIVPVVVPQSLADAPSEVRWSQEDTVTLDGDSLIFGVPVSLAPGATGLVTWRVALGGQVDLSDPAIIAGWEAERVDLHDRAVTLAAAHRIEPSPTTSSEPVVAASGAPTTTPPSPTSSSTVSSDGSTSSTSPTSSPSPSTTAPPELALGGGTFEVAEQDQLAHEISTTGGSGDVRLSVSSGSLPPGATLSPTGVGGTISADAVDDLAIGVTRTYEATVTATAEDGSTDEVEFEWTVENTHFEMPDYVFGLSRGDGSDGLPNIIESGLYTATFACRPGAGEAQDGAIVGQSVSPGMIVPIGVEVTFTVWRRDCA